MNREHIEHLAAAAGALVFALFISYFNTGAVIHFAPLTRATGTLHPVASDTDIGTSTFPGLILSTSTVEAIFPSAPAKKVTASTTPKASTGTTPTPLKPKTTPPVVTKPPVAPTVPAPTPAATPPSEQATSTDTGDALSALRGSVVNIICISHVSNLKGISGSGVVIDSRGLILTVTHVAQMLLLEEREGRSKISCTVRTGSPARNAYLARPVYVSEEWLKANSTTLISSQPTGTGEHDYAVIAITGSATATPLPGAYRAVSATSVSTKVGSLVYIGSYGAQDLTTKEVGNALYPTLTTSKVTDRYTFGGNTVDVLAIAGNDAAQEGSSGGAVENADGKLIGIITTSSITGPTSSREMRIITVGYIARDFMDATGKDFDSYLNDVSVTTLVNSYAPTAQKLGDFLANAIGLE